MVRLHSNTHEKIIQSCQTMLIDLTINLQYYGNFLFFLSFFERNDIKTCGVNVTNNGMNFYYNKDYLDQISQKSVNFIVIHEIFHLLWRHPQRTVSGLFNHKIANIVQDMIINTIIWQDIDHNFIEIPKNNEGKNIGLFVPEEYNGPLIFEFLYEWINDNKDEYSKSDENNLNQGENYSLNDIFNDIEKNNGEYLDSHIPDEIPEEMRQAIIKDAIDRVRSRGIENSYFSETLLKLRKNNKDHLSYIKKTLNNSIIGTKKQKTITRPNRRGIEGLKGYRRVKVTITIILDTSGSMRGKFEKILSYVYRNDIEINLIEADTSVKWIKKIKSKNKLSSIPIKGLGGTILQPAVDYAVDKFKKTNLLILTDGLCDNLDVSGISSNILIISTDRKIVISKSNGKVKQIII